MKKILLLLLLFAPLYVSGQTWCTADAEAIRYGDDNTEWQECHNRICVLNDGDVKIFTPNKTIILYRIGEHYTKEEGSEISYMSWPCVDNEEGRCEFSYNNIEGENFVIIEYNYCSILYHVIPDD